jgi:hypothetical protein
MRTYIRPVEISIQESDFKRRLLCFALMEENLILHRDSDQTRETKRHKWKTVKCWDRVDRRASNMERREVPLDAIMGGLKMMRDKIQYSE